MARDPQRQAGSRQPVESSLNSPGLAVAAHETAVPVPRNDYRPRVSPDAVLLTNALASFVPTLTRAAHEEAQRAERADYLAGQAGRLEATDDILNNKDKYLQSHTAAYVRGFMYADGKSAAADLATQMRTEWLSVKDSLVTPGQYDKWASSYTQNALQGIDDAEFTQGFLESFSRTDEELRGKTVENNYLLQQQSASSALIKGYKGELAGLVNTNASIADLHTSMQAWRDNARQLGLSNQEINEHQFETIRELASETLDISLFDVFERESADVDNPERMVPGLANSPDWQAKIFDAKERVARAIEAKKSKQDELAQFHLRNQINSYIINEDWSAAEQTILKGVEKGLLLGEAGASMQKEVYTERKKAREYAQALDFARAGNWAGFEAVPGGTAANKKKALDQISGERWLDAGNDPLRQQEALALDLEMSAAAGEKLSRYEESLRWPPTSRNFGPAYEMYRAMRAADPATAESYLTEEQSRWFNVYEGAIRSGFNNEEAQAIAITYGTKEAMDKAQDQFRQLRRDHETFIREALIADAKAPFWGRNMDAGDEAKVVSTVDAMMTTHLLSSGGNVTIEQARDWAIQRFKDTHTAIKKPGTDEVTYMRNGIGAPPADLVDAVDYASKKLQEEFKDSPYHDEKGYYIDRSPQGDYIVYRVSNNLPIPSGRGIMRFKDLNTVINDYRSSKVVEVAPVDVEAKKREHGMEQLSRQFHEGIRRGSGKTVDPELAAKYRVARAEEQARSRRAEEEARQRIIQPALDRAQAEEKARTARIEANREKAKKRRKRN